MVALVQDVEQWDLVLKDYLSQPQEEFVALALLAFESQQRQLLDF
jgi:hypothetical protein